VPNDPAARVHGNYHTYMHGPVRGRDGSYYIRVHGNGKFPMLATRTGFRIELTQPLAASVTESGLRDALKLESWTYRDAPQYGSDELGLRSEEMRSLTLSADRKTISIELESLTQARLHPQQTGRVYHAQLATQTLFDTASPEQLDAYYTLHSFPERD
jgi:hypothetical protein